MAKYIALPASLPSYTNDRLMARKTRPTYKVTVKVERKKILHDNLSLLTPILNDTQLAIRSTPTQLNEMNSLLISVRQTVKLSNSPVDSWTIRHTSQCNVRTQSSKEVNITWRHQSSLPRVARYMARPLIDVFRKPRYILVYQTHTADIDF